MTHDKLEQFRKLGERNSNLAASTKDHGGYVDDAFLKFENLQRLKEKNEQFVSELDRLGYKIADGAVLYDWQTATPVKISTHNEAELPQGAREFLTPTNPRLTSLRERYALFDRTATDSVFWDDNRVSADDLAYFRGDNAYVWQLRGRNMHVLGYALSTYYAKSVDRLRLLDTLEEDELFGNFTFRVDQRLVSRDLLDSVLEISFLERHLALSSVRDLHILDIGAGYGRLAHRAALGLGTLGCYFCTDAHPASTFISEYYLRFRGLEQKAKVVPLHEIEDTLSRQKISLAVNVHSFSECKPDAIHWWMSLLRKNNVENLFIVPNDYATGGKMLLTYDYKRNRFDNFQDIVEEHGYKLKIKEPKFLDPVVQQFGINPTYYYLFELAA
jgi:hypothetical protein